MATAPKTLFIENDERIDRSRLDTLAALMDREFKFDEEITDAMFEGPKVWEAILRADEIYIDTALIGNSAILFENMVLHAHHFNLKNKKLFMFREVSKILDYVDHIEEINEVFQNNELYGLSKDHFTFEKVTF